MDKLHSQVTCPVCSGPMAPRVLACEPCAVRVEGRFAANEFAALPAEQLQFLRLFVHYEGRIKDLEKALGISYPTVKSLLSRLKATLGLPDEARPLIPSEEAREPEPSQRRGSVADVLGAVERGTLSIDDALRQLRANKKRKD